MGYTYCAAPCKPLPPYPTDARNDKMPRMHKMLLRKQGAAANNTLTPSPAPLHPMQPLN